MAVLRVVGVVSSAKNDKNIKRKMGTYSKAFIKVDSIDAVKSSIGKYYRIVNQEIDEVEKELKFWRNGSDTIVISKTYNESWVDIVLNFDLTIYIHDEFLRRLSKDLETEILLAYYQSTDGTGRFAKFMKGELQFSIVQCHLNFDPNSILALADNWGITPELRTEFSIPSLKEPFFEITWDSIPKFYKMNGLEWDGKTRDEEIHYHLEIRYQ